MKNGGNVSAKFGRTPEKLVLRGKGEIFVWQALILIFLSVPALAISSLMINKFHLVDDFHKRVAPFLVGMGCLLVVIFILLLTLSKKERRIEITRDCVKFPESRFHKYLFKKREIRGINVIVPWGWRIGRYLGCALFLRVFYTESGTLKNAGQAVYEDFNPEEVVEALRSFGYKVNECGLGKSYFTLEEGK